MNNCVVRLFVLVLTAFFLFSAGCASLIVNATSQPNVSIDYSACVVTVTGNCGEGHADEYAAMQVLNPGKSIEDLRRDSSALNWSDLGRVSKSGDYMFSFNIEGNTGEYIVIVGVEEGETHIASFTYYGSDEVTAILNRLKSHSASEVEWVLNNRQEIIQINLDEYEKLPELNCGLLHEGIARADINSIQELADVYMAVLNVQKLNMCDEIEDFKTQFDNTVTGSNEAVDNIFANYSEARKEEIYTAFMAKDFVDISEILNDYYSAVVLDEINNNVTLWTQLEVLLQNVHDVLELDFTEYNKLTNKSAALSKMLNYQYKYFDEIKSMFEETVTYQLNAEKSKEQKNGSGSGKSSSSEGSVTIGQPQSLNVPALTELSENTRTAAMRKFEDLFDYDWAVEAISMFAEKGLLSGKDSGLFRPSDSVTRAEFVKMFVSAFGLEFGGALHFEDVSEDDWYYHYVSAAYSAGLVQGVSPNEFGPDINITRQDIAVIIQRYMNLSFDAGGLSFNDKDEIDSYAVDSVLALTKNGIINGYDNGSFMPNQLTTRAEAAVICYRCFVNIKD